MKIKRILLMTLGASLAVVICLGAWMLGFATRSQNAVYRWLLAGSLAALAAMAVVNGVCRWRYSAAEKEKSARQMYDEELRYKAETDASPAGKEKSLRRHLAAAAVWEAAVILLLLLSCFFAGKATSTQEGGASSAATTGIVICVLACLLLSGYIFPLLGVSEEEEAEAGRMPELRREEYPHVFSLVEKAAERAGVKGGADVFFFDAGFFVFEKRGKVNVCLDVDQLSLMTDEEVYAVLLHEFAHVRNKDTAKSARYARFCRLLQVPDLDMNVFALSGLLYGWFAARVAAEVERVNFYDSRRREILADRFVKECGFAQIYVNATAKSAMYGLFLEEAAPDLSSAVYAGEEYPKNICDLYLDSFAGHLGARKEYWDAVLRRELPARVDSHPTLKMRMENAGVADYDISAREKDPESLAERKKMRGEFSSVMRERLGEYYPLQKKEWQEKVDKKREFLAREEAGEDISEGELLDYIEFLYRLYDDCALRAAERLMQKNPDSPAAACYKGQILAERGDRECLPLLYRAAEEPEFTDAAMQTAGIFVLRTGEQALVDDYRSRTVSMVQKYMDNVKESPESMRIGAKDALVPCDIPAPLLRPMIERLVCAGGGRITRIYAAVKRAEGKAFYCYLIEMVPEKRGRAGKAEREEIRKVWTEIYFCFRESGLPEVYRRFHVCSQSERSLAKHIRKAGTPLYDAERGLLLPESAGNEAAS